MASLWNVRSLSAELLIHQVQNLARRYQYHCFPDLLPFRSKLSAPDPNKGHPEPSICLTLSFTAQGAPRGLPLHLPLAWERWAETRGSHRIKMSADCKRRPKTKSFCLLSCWQQVHRCQENPLLQSPNLQRILLMSNVHPENSQGPSHTGLCWKLYIK